jgi:aminoglycoside 3-N-acetyltransferase I
MEQQLPIRYHKLTNNDLKKLIQLIRVYEEVFEMKNFSLPGTAHLQSLLAKEQMIFYVALLDNHVIGGLTAHTLPSVYFESNEIYIYDLAVKTEYQRKGIGTQLINELKVYCKSLGNKEIFVQADLDDKYALDFYNATGGTPENVIHFSYDLQK